MPMLLPDSTDAFLARFYSFADAVIRKIEIVYAEDGTRQVTLWIAARDRDSASQDAWVTACLVVSGVDSLRVSESDRTSLQVLSNGLHLAWFGDTVAIECGSLIDPPTNLEDVLASDLFLIGKRVNWSVGAY